MYMYVHVCVCKAFTFTLYLISHLMISGHTDMLINDFIKKKPGGFGQLDLNKATLHLVCEQH